MDKNLIKYIRENYPSLNVWDDYRALEAYKLIQEHQIINEFLYTVEPEKTTQQVIKQAGYGVHVNYSSNRISLTFDTLEKDYLYKVNKVMDSFGWFPAYIDNKNGGKYSDKISNFIGKHEISIDYEAKYDTEFKLINQYIYHLTPDLKWPKVKHFGLTPKSQSKLSDHPGRIYFMENINDLEEYGGDLTDISFTLLDKYPHKDKVQEMYLLKIDTDKLKNITFFEDNNFFMGNAIWTYQNIPPSAISIDRKINVTY